MRVRPLLLVLLVLAGLAPALLPGRRAVAEEAWERAVREAEAEEDRLIERARARGTTRQVVARYASRASRQPTALNLYLLGRAHYYDGDVAAAERHLRRALQTDPAFWFAHLKLAVLELERERPGIAEQHLQQVLVRRPASVEARRLLARVRIEAEDWDGALRVLEDLLADEPTDDEIRHTIAFVHVSRKDWNAALGALKVLRGRRPDDPSVRWYHAQALMETGDLEQAAREFEAIARDAPRDPGPLEMLRTIYAQQRDLPRLRSALERMLPLAGGEPEIREKILEMLAQIERYERAPESVPDVGEQPRDPEAAWAAHVERCRADDVAVRRTALQAYYEARYPVMPSVLIRRIHAGIESDPICRGWILRILGALQNPRLAQVAAFGLYDPEVGVRCLAAESLGEIGAPSGVLYLLPFLLGERAEGPITEASVRELNAARAALIRLTNHLDPAGGEDAWVEAADVAAIRRHWSEFFVTPEGRAARLAAIRDLGAQGDLRPELHLMDEVLGDERELALAAYAVLRERALTIQAGDEDASLWRPFPRHDPAALDEATWPAVQAEVRTWWEGWLDARRAAHADAAGAGDG